MCTSNSVGFYCTRSPLVGCSLIQPVSIYNLRQIQPCSEPVNKNISMKAISHGLLCLALACYMHNICERSPALRTTADPEFLDSEGSPRATNVVLVVVIRFSKIPKALSIRNRS